MNLKAQQRDRLIYEFAILLQPFHDLIMSSQPPPVGDYRTAIAMVQGGDAQWRNTVKEFTTFAEDLVYKKEQNAISHVPELLRISTYDLINNPELNTNLAELRTSFKHRYDGARSRFFELIDHVPIEWEPVIFAANTPFTAYLRIKEAIAIVRSRLHYFDNYLKPEFFQLFLANVNRSVEIRLITTQGNQTYGIKSIEHVSDLAQREFDDYQLIDVPQRTIHDRNLRIDDHIFTLGPGIDRSGIALTNFGPSDNSAEAHHEFDNIIRTGVIVHRS